MVAVLEHNRLDLLTLAALTAKLLQLVRLGPEAAQNSREAYALGTTYARAEMDERARDCFARAVAMSSAPPDAFDSVRLESLRALALMWRRARQFDNAAACWRKLIDTRGCPPAMHREAAEALAIHHEHRVHDLDAAKAFALKSLSDEARPAWTQAVQHRLARLDRKLSVGRLL
jgi:tetratricopeptide (TPR) repeat protein